MKEDKIKKIIILAISIVIIVGIIITAVVGFNFELMYQDSKKVELYLNKEFEISDMKQIANEVFENKETIIQKVEVFEDSVSIIAKDITEEQKNNLVTKVNEKYGTELQAESTEIISIPHTKGKDIIKPYIVPYIISTAIILCYMAIRYYKLNTVKVLGKLILGIILVQAILFSLFAITRLPISRYTMPISIAVYILTLLQATNMFEKELAIVKEEDNEE